MQQIFQVFLAGTMLFLSMGAIAAPHHGQVQLVQGQAQAFESSAGDWLPVVAFWQRHAEQGSGKFWGQSRDYPPYEQVNEFDTFMVETAQGLCLMEFFHQRWRRANDVRRWDEQHNSLYGCPTVFD